MEGERDGGGGGGYRKESDNENQCQLSEKFLGGIWECSLEAQEEDSLRSSDLNGIEKILAEA